jgi:hypothetical protein
MFLSQLFESQPISERLTLAGGKTLRRLLLSRGWAPTTVPDEYRNHEAPGYSVDLDVHSVDGDGPFTVFRGSRKIGQFPYPPYASHLMMRP